MPLYAEHIKTLDKLKDYIEKGDEVWTEYIEELDDRLKEDQRRIYGYKLDTDSLETYFKEYIKPSETLQFYYIQEWYKPIGFVVLDVDKLAHTVYINEFFIRPKHRRTGKGTAIMKQLHDVTRRNDFKLTSIGVPNYYGTGAKAFLKEVGFDTAAVIMVKEVRK